GPLCGDRERRGSFVPYPRNLLRERPENAGAARTNIPGKSARPRRPHRTRNANGPGVSPGRISPPPRGGWSPVLAGDRQIDRARTFAARIRLGVELHLLTLGQGGEPGTLHRGNVNEHVATAVRRRDKTKALRGVEELNGPSQLAHDWPFLKLAADSPPLCVRRA